MVFEVSLGYTVSSRLPGTTVRDLFSKNDNPTHAHPLDFRREDIAKNCGWHILGSSKYLLRE